MVFKYHLTLLWMWLLILLLYLIDGFPWLSYYIQLILSDTDHCFLHKHTEGKNSYTLGSGIQLSSTAPAWQVQGPECDSWYKKILHFDVNSYLLRNTLKQDLALKISMGVHYFSVIFYWVSGINRLLIL